MVWLRPLPLLLCPTGTGERRHNAADATCRRRAERRQQRLERSDPAATVALAVCRHDVQRSSSISYQTVPTNTRHPPASRHADSLLPSYISTRTVFKYTHIRCK